MYLWSYRPRILYLIIIVFRKSIQHFFIVFKPRTFRRRFLFLLVLPDDALNNPLLLKMFMLFILLLYNADNESVMPKTAEVMYLVICLGLWVCAYFNFQ